jgi:catechol 2,3-dioxygenase-like lactoylglutathione lyase family enzyme
MLTNLVSCSVYVLNLEDALDFYVNRLGFQVHTDIIIDSEKRWASVCMPDDPDTQLMLIPVEEGTLFNHDQVAKMRELISHEIFSYGVFRCNDVENTCRELKQKGVRFLMEPGVGFLGQYEAAFSDNSGNWFRLTQEPDAV